MPGFFSSLLAGTPSACGRRCAFAEGWSLSMNCRMKKMPGRRPSAGSPGRAGRAPPPVEARPGRAPAPRGDGLDRELHVDALRLVLLVPVPDGVHHDSRTRPTVVHGLLVEADEGRSTGRARSAPRPHLEAAGDVEGDRPVSEAFVIGEECVPSIPWTAVRCGAASMRSGEVKATEAGEGPAEAGTRRPPRSPDPRRAASRPRRRPAARLRRPAVVRSALERETPAPCVAAKSTRARPGRPSRLEGRERGSTSRPPTSGLDSTRGPSSATATRPPDPPPPSRRRRRRPPRGLRAAGSAEPPPSAGRSDSSRRTRRRGPARSPRRGAPSRTGGPLARALPTARQLGARRARPDAASAPSRAGRRPACSRASRSRRTAGARGVEGTV